jgi:uncharacterized protein YjbI with pentapeptide repeats
VAATFSAPANFGSANFTAKGDFFSATFGAAAIFSRATFADANFTYAIFSAGAYFNQAIFANYVNLRAVKTDSRLATAHHWICRVLQSRNPIGFRSTR